MPEVYLETPKTKTPNKETEDLLASLTITANAYLCPDCGCTIEAEGEVSERECEECGTIMVGALLASDSEGKADYEKSPFKYEIADDMMIVKNVPVINTGYWNYRRFDKEELEAMFEEWGNKQKDLVADHLDDVSKLWGVARKPQLLEKDGVYTITANLLITREEAIKFLTSLEKVGKRLQISPRITWEIMDGKEVNPKIMHVAAVLRGAQGEAAELGKEETVSKKKDKEVISVDLEDEQLQKDKEKEKEKEEMQEEEPEKDKEKEKMQEGEEEPEKDKEKEEEEEDEKRTDPEKKEDKQAEGEEEEPPEKEKEEEKEDEEAINTENDSPIMGLTDIQQEIGHVLADPEATPEALKAFLMKINEFISKYKKTQAKEKEGEDGYPYPEPDKKKEKDQSQDSTHEAVKGLMASSSAHVKTRSDTEKIEDNVYKKELLFPTLCVLPQSRDWSAQVAVSIDDAMIDTVIENFEKLGSKVPVFIGHIPVGEEDKHLEQAIGWITSLGKEDGRLYANRLEITNEAVKDRIDDKTLQDASVGMLFQYTDSEGKQIGPVLRHLGVVAVGLFKGLKGFEKLAASDEVPEGDIALEPIDVTSPQLESLRSELQDTKRKMEKFAEQYTSLSGKLLEVRKEDLEAKILTLVEKGVIKPAYKETLKEIINKTAELEGDEKIAEKVLGLLSDGVVDVDLSKPKVDAAEAANKLAASDRHYFTKEELVTDKFRSLFRQGKVDQDDRCVPFCKKEDWDS